eukprot:2869896-Rhodomonas_salina.4
MPGTDVVYCATRTYCVYLLPTPSGGTHAMYDPTYRVPGSHRDVSSISANVDECDLMCFKLLCHLGCNSGADCGGF